MSRPPLPGAIAAGRVLAIARRLDPAAAPGLVEALRDGGLAVLEVTLDGDHALDVIAGLAGGPLLVGAGTVLSVPSAEAAVAAGAAFVVSPHVDPEIVAWAVGSHVPVLAGAYTATEIMTAWDAGASAVKLFPAAAGGPDLVRHLRGPLPHVPLVPTGGVDGGNARAFLDAGAVAVGVGSWLTGADLDAVRSRAALLAGLGAG